MSDLQAPVQQHLARHCNWARHAIFWHLYPLGFVGAEKQRDHQQAIQHRLLAIVPWLDYARDLGVTALLLGPMFCSETHGYDTTDYFRIDQRLGDDDDFKTLMDAAHDRGLRVVLDGVFNHVGLEFPAYQDVLKHGRNSAMGEWFHLTWPDPSASDQQPSVANFEGHAQLARLNHTTPAVVEHIKKVMLHWLARGADGWRLDAAYSVDASLWRSVLPEVTKRFPDAYIVGEVIHGNYSAMVESSGVDAVTQYELWKAVWSSLNDHNWFELKHALERHNAWLGSFLPMIFIGNHDVTRIASKLIEPRHIALATVLLLTLPGVPSIYAGDEQGFRAIKEARPGGDDAIRAPFPSSPSGLAPYGWPLYRLHQSLIGLRRQRDWLADARVSIVQLSQTLLCYRVESQHQALVVVLNAAEKPCTQKLSQPLRWLEGDGCRHDAQALLLQLEGFGWAVLEKNATR